MSLPRFFIDSPLPDDGEVALPFNESELRHINVRRCEVGEHIACFTEGRQAWEVEITYIDDLHLLPFDGIADWDGIARRLNRCGFSGPLTFELNTLSKPNRHENDGYAALPLEQYLALAYGRACRVATLVERRAADVR